MTQQTILERIKKLINLSENAGATASEAEAAMKAAQKLLLKHNLSMKDVSINELKSDIKQTDYLSICDNKEEGKWEALLSAIIAEANFCQSVTNKVLSEEKKVLASRVFFIGTETNVDTTCYLFEIARELFRSASKKAYNLHRKTTMQEYDSIEERELQKLGILKYRFPFIRSFLKGCNNGLAIQFYQNKTQDTVDEQNAYALISTNHETAIQEFMNEHHSDIKEGRKRSNKVDPDAFIAGVDAGKNAQLNKGVAGTEVDESKLIG